MELGEPSVPLQGNAVKVEGGKLYMLVGINPLEFEVLLGSVYPTGRVGTIEFWKG